MWRLRWHAFHLLSNMSVCCISQPEVSCAHTASKEISEKRYSLSVSLPAYVPSSWTSPIPSIHCLFLPTSHLLMWLTVRFFLLFCCVSSCVVRLAIFAHNTGAQHKRATAGVWHRCVSGMYGFAYCYKRERKHNKKCHSPQDQFQLNIKKSFSPPFCFHTTACGSNFDTAALSHSVFFFFIYLPFNRCILS